MSAISKRLSMTPSIALKLNIVIEKLRMETATLGESSQICLPSLDACYCGFVSAVLKPLVEVLSDPDSINRMLLSQLEQREQQAEQQKKAYTYAASYEDFIKLISTSADVDFLKQLRHAGHPR